MKRGIDDKSMGPMFPRLHVNDTEKGGPRTPPRNKMALYEQLSIPSQRFTGANLNSNNAPLPSGGVSERGSFLPHQQTHRVQAADKTKNRYSELKNQLAQQEPKKKQQDEDFMVPVFVEQSGMNLDHRENRQNKDNQVISHSNSAFLSRLTNVQKASERNNHRNTNVQLKETNGSNKYIRPQSHVTDSQTEISEAIIVDDVSETSMVDSLSELDISPDDVVGVIGQKHFWKARRAIVNQQRVFNVQLFELHRLIKVQRLIAEIPHSMVENDPFLLKPTKVSPIKKIPLPLESVLKSSTNVPKVNDHREKSKDDAREFSAENAVEKTSISSVQNSGWSTFTGYPLPPSDPKMGPWSMSQQQPAHQWLIPVMSPSEGLIYKPYPGPAYMTPGPGPPPGQNFVNHGVPPAAQPHYQWPAGLHPLVPPPNHGYFPPYGMTTMNPSPYNQYQSPSNNNEAQVSTRSSTSGRTENRDALPLFPMGPETEVVEEPTRVIRVIPRNARSSTESLARIFQFIQEERNKQDSV